MVQSLWKTVWQLLTKLNILLPYNPAIVLLGIYPKELKTDVHTKTCTQMFTAALIIIVKTWKQPRCPAVGEWINQFWYIQTMEYYSALKRNELSRHKNTWNNLKCILLSERNQSKKAAYLKCILLSARSQSKKAAYCMILTICRSGKGKPMETIKRSVVAGMGVGTDDYAEHRGFLEQ